MEETDCKVCKKFVKEKYKNYKIWRLTAIIFIILSVIFAILYFANGKVFTEKSIENNVKIENIDGQNENNVVTGDNSTISGTVETKSNIGVIIIISVLILSGGILGGCYIISSRKNS